MEGFQAMDQIGEEEPPGCSILTFSSPFLFLMLTTPFIMPRARYWPSFVHLWIAKPRNQKRKKYKNKAEMLVNTKACLYHLPTTCYLAAYFML